MFIIKKEYMFIYNLSEFSSEKIKNLSEFFHLDFSVILLALESETFLIG